MLDDDGVVTITHLVTVFQPHVLTCLFQYLNVTELLNIRQVCKTFRNAVKLTGVIRKRVFHCNKNNFSNMDTTQVERLNLPLDKCLACPNQSNLLEKVLCCVSNLQYLSFTLGVCKFDCSLLPKRLKRLKINCSWGKLLGLGEVSTNLEQLRIYGTCRIDYNVDLEKLEKLKVLHFYASDFNSRLLTVPKNVEDFHYCICNYRAFIPSILGPEMLARYKYQIRETLKIRREMKEYITLDFRRLTNLKEFTTTHGFDMNFGDKVVSKFFSNCVDDEIVFQFLK